MTHFRRTIDGGTRPSRLPNWVMVERSTLPRSLNAIQRRSAVERRSWKRQMNWTRLVSEKKGGVQKGDRDQRCRRSELLKDSRGSHCWRSDAHRREMDELVT